MCEEYTVTVVFNMSYSDSEQISEIHIGAKKLKAR